ncbi:MAG: type II toxin-antitoxin system HicA family toxin [Bryobacteraceae bacterium]
MRYLLGRFRVLSGAEVCRILEQNGFVTVRQRGSHRIMQKRLDATTITIPVPLHNPLILLSGLNTSMQHLPMPPSWRMKNS